MATSTLLIQDGFSYNFVHTQLFDQFTFGSSSITTANGKVSLNVSTSIYDYAVMRGKQLIKYRIGYPIVIRFSAKYDTPVASSIQMAGVGTAGNDIYIGYTGTDFSARVSTGGTEEVRLMTLSVGASDAETFTLTLNDVVYTGSLTLSSIAVNLNQIINANTYSGWQLQIINDTIVFRNENVGALSGTYSFSSTISATGAFSTITTGTALNTTVFLIDDWNGDTSAIRRLDPTAWNMYEIEYGYYGVSNIVFRVFNEYTNIYDTIQEVRFTDSSITVGLSNPSMYLQTLVASLGSTTAMTMEIAGIYAAITGNLGGLIHPRYTVNNDITIGVTSQEIVLVIGHTEILNGLIAVDAVHLRRISFATDGLAPVRFEIWKNPTTLSATTVSDYHQYTYIDETQSLSLLDTTSRTFTGGIKLMDILMGATDATNLELHHRDIYIQRGEEVFVTAYSLLASSVFVSISIAEDI